MSMKTASATSRMMETKSGRISVQRITVVIDRRRNTLAFEGVWATTAVSDMRLENSKGDRNCQFRIARIAGFKDGGVFWRKLELSLTKILRFNPSTYPSTILEGC